MPFFEHDGLRFHYHDQGSGIPFFFQHGLGGDVSQPVGLFTPPPGFRLLAFDCRGHGETRPLGVTDKFTFSAFADDLWELMTYLDIPCAVVGGISMGAGGALNFTLRFPERVLGVVLSRPAWLDQPMSKNAEIFGMIADLLRQHGAQRGLELFKQSEVYARLLRLSPETANSLAGQFEHPRAEETAIKLQRLPHDAPNRDRREWAAITVPTLVLANRHDPIHPLEYGKQLAQNIPDAEFQEITSKSISREQHTLDVQRAIESFLIKNTARFQIDKS